MKVRCSSARWVLGSWLVVGAGACSDGYSLGDLTESQPLEGEQGPTGDFAPGATLGAPDVTLEYGGTSAYAAAVGLGDLDGDGYGDIAAFELEEAAGISVVRIRYGGPRPSSSGEVFMLSLGGATLFGGGVGSFGLDAIVPAGDVNGDGYADALVASTDCASITGDSSAYLVYGGAERLDGVFDVGEVGVELVAPAADEVDESSGSCYSGAVRVTGVGDLDGDGLDDFVLNKGAFDTRDEERAYLFYGREASLDAGTRWDSADATLRAQEVFPVIQLGDVDADGLADVMFGSAYPYPAEGTANAVLIRGRRERLSGEVDILAAGTPLPGATHYSWIPMQPLGDLDGDGINDLVIVDRDGKAHLFYGAPGLFTDGFSLDAADAQIQSTEDYRPQVRWAGDLDGDGDVELMTLFWRPELAPDTLDVALIAGGPARLSGTVAFPFDAARAENPGTRFEYRPFRSIDDVAPAGDVDGDGVDDVLTLAQDHLPVAEDTTSVQNRGLNIHYGHLGGAAAASDDPR
jgi:hypothetical protein